MKEYEKLYKKENVKAHKETIDWQDVHAHYGELKDEVIKLNTPDTITDNIDLKKIEDNWEKIRQIIASVPTYDEMVDLMHRAGAVTTCEQIGVSEKLKEEGLKYHPYMRRRLSLMRLSYLID